MYLEAKESYFKTEPRMIGITTENCTEKEHSTEKKKHSFYQSGKHYFERIEGKLQFEISKINCNAGKGKICWSSLK